MKIKFHGAAREVTGSKHEVTVNGYKILLDSGMFQGQRDEAEERNCNSCLVPEDIDAVILSHAHIDHSGNLPRLVKRGFDGPIFTTFATRDLCNHMLMDSAYIQERDAEYQNKHRKKGEPKVEPEYTVEDAQEALKKFVGYYYHRKFEVVPGVMCTFYDAGHILGSAITYLEIDDKDTGKKYTLTFTGDLGRKDLPIIRDPEIPPKTNILITESTYGNKVHEPMSKAGEELADAINRTYDRGGKVIIPAFAVERTQELVYHLNILMSKKKIPKIPIFVDSPLASNVTEVYRNHPECYDKETREEFVNNDKNPFGFGLLTYIRAAEDSIALNDRKDPCIIISASGMCEFGRIKHHLKHNIEDPKTTVLIVGFMAKNTLGRKLVEGDKTVKIFRERYQVKADIVRLNSFSGHADKNDLLSFCLKLKPDLKYTFLVHGEEEQAQVFQQTLIDSGFENVRLPYPQDEYDIIF